MILPPKTEIRAFKYVELDGSSSRFHRKPGHRIVRHKVGKTYRSTSNNGFWVATREWVKRMVLVDGEAILEVSVLYEDVVEVPNESPVFPAWGTFRVRKYTVVGLSRSCDVGRNVVRKRMEHKAGHGKQGKTKA